MISTLVEKENSLRRMGSSRSIPETLDEITLRALAGINFDKDEFENLSMGRGYITRTQLVAAAQARGLGESLRRNRSEKFFLSDEPDSEREERAESTDRSEQRTVEVGVEQLTISRPTLDGSYRSLSSDYATDDEDSINDENERKVCFAPSDMRRESTGAAETKDNDAEYKLDVEGLRSERKQSGRSVEEKVSH